MTSCKITELKYVSNEVTSLLHQSIQLFCANVFIFLITYGVVLDVMCLFTLSGQSHCCWWPAKSRAPRHRPPWCCPRSSEIVKQGFTLSVLKAKHSGITGSTAWLLVLCLLVSTEQGLYRQLSARLLSNVSTYLKRQGIIRTCSIYVGNGTPADDHERFSLGIQIRWKSNSTWLFAWSGAPLQEWFTPW